MRDKGWQLVIPNLSSLIRRSIAMARRRVVLAGGSGFLGQALAASFLAEGCEVHVLSRDPQAGAPASRDLLGTVVPWDGTTIGPWTESLEDAAAVINLAGKNINCRPTKVNRLNIGLSRIFATQAVCEAVSQCRRPPRVVVQTSAVGIYGDCGDAICDETTPAGGGFLGATCKEWERAFAENPTPGIRRVMLRLGVVLGRGGGAFPPLARLARWFLGGAAGSGRQYISWLHLSDAVRIDRAAIDGDDFQGVYVAAAPQPVTNAEFMRALRRRCGGRGARPCRPWRYRSAAGSRASMRSWF